MYKALLRKVIGLFMNLLVTILAVDLLYLYYSGGWYDPIKWIEITEVAFLYLFVVAGIVGAVLKLREYIHE